MPVTDDDVVLGFPGAPTATNANLGVQLRSVTLNAGTGNLWISGAIALQSGGFITDNNANHGTTDHINASIALNGSTAFTLAAVSTQILAFNGAITGTAPLTLVNNSANDALRLNFANTYTGATTIDGTDRVLLNVNGAVPTGSALTVNGSALFNAGSTIGSLAGGGNVFMNGSNTLTVGGDNTSTTFSGVYQNSGGSAALIKVGSGTFTLSGANTYSGGTTVSAGTLSGTTTSLQGNIVNNSAVTFGQAANGTYAGNMSGTGSLTKAGTGTVTLSGTNTYSGGTTVNAGTLRAGAANAFGSGGAPLVASGATLDFNNFNQTLGSLSGAGNMALGTATLTIGGDNADSTFSGVISGSGGLTKNGTGKTILSGAYTYTGATNINGGILSVNGSLASNVFDNSGGVIAPGNSPGILTVNSLTLNPGSTTRMEINGLTAGTQYDQIVVNNTATLGGTLDLVFGYTPSANSRFTLIRAGNIASGFAAIQSNLGAALQASTVIDPTTFDILIALRQNSF